LPSPLYAVLERLFDDGSLFPPASRTMAEALRAYAEAMSGPHRRVVGPFLCPASRLPEMAASVAGGVPAPEAIGVVGYDGSSGWRQVFTTPGLVHVETPAGAQVPLSPGRVRRYVEVGSQDELARALDAIAEAGHRVKVRASGPTRYAVPTSEWLAAVLIGCEQRKLVLKAAGDLHRPFRESGDTAPRHGFVNLLAAAAATRSGAPAPAVAEVLSAEGADAAGLVDRVGGCRELVASLTVPSVDDPVRELTARGLL
jgi:hypothetical protein